MALYTKPYNGEKPIFQEFQTPVGKVVYCFHDVPNLEVTDSQPPKPVMDEEGIQKANYKVTLAWPKAFKDRELMPMRQLASQVVEEAWGPGALADPWLNLQAFLRDGDNPEHNTMKKEFLFGMVYLNFKSKAKAQRLSDGKVTYSGKPGLVDEYSNDLLPVDMYAGCDARISGIMFGTMYSGKRFISTRLNNIQRAPAPPGGFERIGGGGRPDAKTQFDPLAAAPGGFGNVIL